MMASWIVATHFRPALLAWALESIRRNTYPAGWNYEVLVAHDPRDRHAVESCDVYANLYSMNIRPVESRHATGGGKRSDALRVATGELVMAADDDDIQSPLRAAAAIRAFTKGHSLSELREFRYLHLDTGAVVRWCGRGDAGRAPVAVGTARNYRRSLLVKAGGWRALPRLIEKDLQARITGRFPTHARALELGKVDGGLADTTICLQHDSNIWGDRPAVERGAEVERGAFRLVGEGTWREAPGFPETVAQQLNLR